MIDGGKARIQEGTHEEESAGMRDVTDTYNATEEAECWGCVYLFCVSVSVCWCQMLDVRVGDKDRDWAGTG